MTPKQEAAVLRELGRIYRNCAERVATFTRWRWITTMAACVLILFAALFSTPDSMVCSVLCSLGGFAAGLSVLLASSANQVPILVQYTILREEELQKRLEKLKDA